MPDLEKSAFERCAEEIRRIGRDSCVRMSMPLEVLTAEAAKLAALARRDREELLGAGIDPLCLNTIEDRARAFTYAAARYVACRERESKDARRWRELAPEGAALLKYLVKHMTFAYRDDPKLFAAVNEIRTGRSNDDMIISLLSAAVLARENPEPLQRMPMFQMSKIDEARALQPELARAWAKVRSEPEGGDGSKLEMQRAFTYFKRSADEITLHGRFVFEGTARYRDYMSDFRKKTNKKPSAVAVLRKE